MTGPAQRSSLRDLPSVDQRVCAMSGAAGRKCPHSAVILPYQLLHYSCASCGCRLPLVAVRQAYVFPGLQRI